MIQLAKAVDERSRAVRKKYEDEIEAVIRVASEKVAKARFAALGTSVYPDATFTLRLSYGSVQGWNEKGTEVVPFTLLSRLFERATGEPPFAVPESWAKAKDKLDLNTKFNLSTNNDIIGGNSGSPVVNRNNELVGIIFDGNIQSLPNRFLYTDEIARAVSVHSAGIIEALDKVYNARPLVNELRSGARAAANGR